ncbi:MAG TPA: tetratricopeptide repeat protein [Thermoanaerobaculia bacterium]|nr:tetratricopeptide repeat protein [Thermoanaerobaculia bacterium]
MSSPAGPPEGDALSVWQEKLGFLRVQEAITADAEQKFALHKQIEEAQNKIRELESASGPTSPKLPALEAASLPRLYQLPSPPADFTGREKDLAALRGALATGGATAIFGLRGMGGVGKTALALKLAHEISAQYPDAQIYLDLLGVTTPLSAPQAMAHVVRSLHPEARLPEEGDALLAVYRSVLHGKRVLLLMDNASGREQVEPLLPPPGCVLLVTSRFRFALPGLTARDLDELPAEEARALLLRISPRIGNAASELARICGGLPLALRLAGSTLADRVDLSPAVYAQRLAAGRERLEPVEASLSLSYELLPIELRKLWRLLAIFPVTFDAAAVAAVWELDDSTADGALGKLVTSSLLEWEEVASRYRLHDLARLFADRHLDEAESAIARRRHATYYLEVLQRADSLYKQGGEGVLHGLRLFDAEWGNLQAGQAWAAAQPPEDAAATALCDDYPDAGAYCLRLRLSEREQIHWRELALAAARRKGDRKAQAVHLGNLGVAYRILGEHDRAIELFEQHLAIAREIGDRRGEGTAIGNLGTAYAALGEPRRAIEFLEQDLAIAREIGNRRGEGNALGNLGNAYSILGEPRRAIELHEQNRAVAREIGDRHGEGNALGNLGIAYRSLGEPRRAIELYEQQLAITREIGDRWGQGRASWNLGLVFEQQGDLALAAELMQVLVDLERGAGQADAEQDAARVSAIRAKLAEGGSSARGGRRSWAFWRKKQ